MLVQFILINISAALYADKLTRYYSNLPEDHSNSGGNIFTKSWKLFSGPRYPRPEINEPPVFTYDTLQLKTSKGLNIDAWYARPDSTAKGTVILFHGIGGTKMTNIDVANEFHYLGYNIMMVDFRGHGNSDGKNTTIGLREAEEVRLAYDHVKATGEQNIYLYGISMGAVALAKAVSKYGLQPSGVIMEMPFYSLQSYLKAKAGQIGFPKQPFAFLTTFWIGIEKGFNGYGHKTTRYVRDIKCPVLLQAGTLDSYVNLSEVRQIYDATASSNKKMVVYEGVGHESIPRKDPEKWRMEIEAFLKSGGK